MFNEYSTLKLEYATSEGFYSGKSITFNTNDIDTFLFELSEFLQMNRILKPNENLVRTTQMYDYTNSIVSQLTRGQH